MIQISLETLARYLPWHLIAKLLQSKRDEELFRYLLGGLRLLHALYDIAPRNSKLEQVHTTNELIIFSFSCSIFYKHTNFSQCRFCLRT